MRFGSTAKVLLKCELKYYRISECVLHLIAQQIDPVTATEHPGLCERMQAEEGGWGGGGGHLLLERPC